MATILPTEGRFTGISKKTKPIKAVQLRSVFTDESFAAAFLVNTMEGAQPVNLDNWLCYGEVGEPWQQSNKAITTKYDVIGVEGLLTVLQPKPENEVEYFVFTEQSVRGKMDSVGTQWVIQGLWGMTIDGVEKLQKLNFGDIVARQTYDHDDQWVVNGPLYAVTYEHQRDL